MKQKITRKDLKRNELAETVTKTVDYVAHHRRGVTEAIVVGAGILVLVAAVFAYRIYRAGEAGRELSAALEILAAPLAGQPAAADAPRTYPTATAREKEAEHHLRKAASHPGTPAGRAALVILAARDSASPKTPETLAKVARSSPAEVGAAAEIDAARALASQGKTMEAADRLKRAIDSGSARVPKDALLFALGEIYEKAGRPADAKAVYQRIVNDYPSSPYRQDARAKLPGSSGAPSFNAS